MKLRELNSKGHKKVKLDFYMTSIRIIRFRQMIMWRTKQ
jgi:hypothetical protein